MPIRPRTTHRPPQPGLLRQWTLWAWFAAALILCLGGVSLWKSGRWLVHEDAFEKAHWGVVLAGESRDCERSDAAIRLYLEGKLDTLVISATRIFKTRYASEFMVDYYAQQGVPRERIFEFRHDTYSTIEEARLLVRQFRLLNLDTAVIVTVSFHTARTRRIFRKLAAGYPVVLVAGADYNVYDPNAFWSNRESLKLWFDEWTKTFFTVFELAKAKPETGKAEYQGLTPDIWSSKTPMELPAPVTAPIADSATNAAVEKSDSGTSRGGAPHPQEDSAGSEPKSEVESDDAKAALDSAVAKADSLKARKDSNKARRDSLKAKASEVAEARPAVKETEPRKTLPRAGKKPAVPAKAVSKASERKPEKPKIKK
ncbi:MAG: ElyC/SanA/YdcF family protein [Fibrobacteria bacterium]